MSVTAVVVKAVWVSNSVDLHFSIHNSFSVRNTSFPVYAVQITICTAYTDN